MGLFRRKYEISINWSIDGKIFTLTYFKGTGCKMNDAKQFVKMLFDKLDASNKTKIFAYQILFIPIRGNNIRAFIRKGGNLSEC